MTNLSLRSWWELFVWLVKSKKEFSLNFDQFLVENISSQLENFHIEGRVFNYYNLLILMVITENLRDLRQIEPVHFSEAADLSKRTATISFFTFSNCIMPVIYKFIFGSIMPRISEDLTSLLQNPTKLIGDWLCYKDSIVIRVYVFEWEPYKFPKFLTRRIFILEYLRKQLSVKNQIFIKHKKVSSIKFMFTQQPFVV